MKELENRIIRNVFENISDEDCVEIYNQWCINTASEDSRYYRNDEEFFQEEYGNGYATPYDIFYSGVFNHDCDQTDDFIRYDGNGNPCTTDEFDMDDTDSIEDIAQLMECASDAGVDIDDELISALEEETGASLGSLDEDSEQDILDRLKNGEDPMEVAESYNK